VKGQVAKDPEAGWLDVGLVAHLMLLQQTASLNQIGTLLGVQQTAERRNGSHLLILITMHSHHVLLVAL